MRALVFVLSIRVAQLMPAVCGCAVDRDDPWDNLRRVNQSRTYMFMDRDSACVAGRIVSFTDQSVTVQSTRWRRSASGKMTEDRRLLILERPRVLFVGERGLVQDAIYSGKSSWSDLKEIHPVAGESVTIVTRDGKQHSGKLAASEENRVTLSRGGKKAEFSKSDVLRFYYVRAKPLSDSGAYAAQEMVFMDPELWPYMLHVAPKIRVMLYDSSMPEDNTPLYCKNNPWDFEQ